MRRSFGNKKWQPLVYVDGGVNFPLNNDNFSAKNFDGSNLFDLNNGFYGEAGLGLNKKIASKLILNFTLGFSYKYFSYLEYGYYFRDFPPYSGGQNPDALQKDFYY